MNAPLLQWEDAGQNHQARWRSEAGVAPPRRVVLADDTMAADHAYRLICEGTALLWQGDFHNARQLLQALARRIDRKPARARAGDASFPHAFHLHRQALGQRARILGQVLVPLAADHSVPLRRAPDFRVACTEAWGMASEPSVASLRELLGLVGAHEWRKKGVPMAALGGDRIHAHYGVFSPVRGEYVQLVADAPWPSGQKDGPQRVFDIGVGTGVLSAVLARRGAQQVVATDLDPRALACAAENLQRLGVAQQVSLVQTDLFPEGRADLVVCNPPWVPAKPSSPIEQAVYDPDSRMLRGFLAGLRDHLAPGGQGWLILSDLAEHLKLRSREDLLRWIDEAGLRVIDRLDTRPLHPKAQDRADPLHAARAAEVTSLWRLATNPASTPAPRAMP